MSTDRASSGLSSSTDEPILLRERRDSNIELLILNRSKARNSLSEAMIVALSDQLQAISHDPSIRAVVLSSTGPAFCAGHDLKELSAHRQDADGGRAFFTKIMQSCGQMMQAIVSLPQPVIAVVQGVATAAGCQLVASCDLAVASDAAVFATPGVNIGLFCSTPMVALSRNVAPKHAMEMLLTGAMVSADHALRIGLVNRVVPAGTELEEALSLARQVVQKSPHAVRVGKTAFYRQLELDLGEAYEYTSKVMVENLLAADAEEGMCAFIEKREPHWQE
jgi:enoyl-CoA hydratase/carnithine racemase